MGSVTFDRVSRARDLPVYLLTLARFRLVNAMSCYICTRVALCYIGGPIAPYLQIPGKVFFGLDDAARPFSSGRHRRLCSPAAGFAVCP